MISITVLAVKLELDDYDWVYFRDYIYTCL